MTSTKSVGSRKGIRETQKFVNRAKMYVRARITSPKLKNIFSLMETAVPMVDQALLSSEQ